MARILVVDDERGIRITMQQYLTKEGHEVLTAENAATAMEQIENHEFDVVVSDIIMSGLNGIELLKNIQKNSPMTQVILITGEPTFETASEAVRDGACDYISKPVTRSHLCSAVKNAAGIKAIQSSNIKYCKNLEAAVRIRTKELEKTHNKIKTSISQTIEALCAAIKIRDPYTSNHQSRVTDLACKISDTMKLDSNRRKGLFVAGLIHDLGKLRIPTDILSRPCSLSKAEFELIKEHPLVAWDILKNVDFPWPVADIVRQHHERLDGSGYPDGLKGDEILMEARILAVADVVEAMASHRPYRPALGLNAAMQEITQKKGRQFDSEVVSACEKVVGVKNFRFKQ